MYASTRVHQYKLFKNIFHAHGKNLFRKRILNARNFFPDIVDFSSLSRFKRSITRSILHFVHLVYLCILGACFLFFFLKATVRLSEPGVSCSESMSLVLHK